MDGLVKGLVWVGSRTEHCEEMVRFYRDVLRLSLAHEEGEFALFRLPDGSKAEVFGPSRTPSTPTSLEDLSPVSWLKTSRVSAGFSRRRASSSSSRPVHEWEATGEAWSHFRAPDGNVYEITHGPKHR